MNIFSDITNCLCMFAFFRCQFKTKVQQNKFECNNFYRCFGRFVVHNIFFKREKYEVRY